MPMFGKSLFESLISNTSLWIIFIKKDKQLILPGVSTAKRRIRRRRVKLKSSPGLNNQPLQPGM